MTIQQFNELVASSGQFSPLFANAPDGNQAIDTNVIGEVKEEEFNGRKFKVFYLKEADKLSDASIGIVRGAETKQTFNIGKFTCVRNYESARGNKFIANVTFRYFAY